MAKFEQGYFDELCKWIRAADNGWYDAYNPGLAIYCNNLDRFISHLRWYELKNKDDRYIYIWQQSETELMYGVKFCRFRLGDIYYPGCMQLDRLPEETRVQKMNRLWKELGQIKTPAPVQQKTPVVIKQMMGRASEQKRLFE